MTGPTCADIERNLVELASGAVAPGEAEEFARHAAECPPCAGAVARERRLQSWLAAIPSGDGRAIAVPQLPDRPPGRVVPLRWAAAAAILVAGLTAVRFRHASGPGQEVAGDAVASLRVVDASESFAAWDDRLLALASSIEVVAARRPTENR